ncbi:alpha/beta fold hydrolase [Comamonadaceae bacterium OH2545_COT-014]|nr:alpha/beta fold hydrolase [Comamonadaceae bacterium OH2545_COT-014]
MNPLPTPTSLYLHCAGHEIHVTDWAPAPGATPRGHVVAWHGLARTGRDMDPLAAHLAARGWRVVCPDTIGRGLSQWAARPQEAYCLAFYARLARELLAQLDITRCHWVGTSMGGAIGTVAAAGQVEPALREAIASLVLNDNAPELAAPALERIKAYAGQPPAFATVTELEAFFRQAYAPYGYLPDAQWRQLTETSTRRLPDGRVTPHYDPAIIGQFIHHPQDYLIWPHYDALRIPVLLLRGESSDLVLPEVVARMRTRGPGAAGLLQVEEVPGCGHAPALNVPTQLDRVTAFLEQAAGLPPPSAACPSAA